MTSEHHSRRRDSWWRTAPVLTIAVLALIMSTAGGAYAVAKNSIGNKQLKNNAVTSGKIKSNTIQSSDLKDGTITGADVKAGSLPASAIAPGQLAPIPAGSSKIFFAKVGTGGNLIAKSAGIVSAVRNGPGSYAVNLSFNADSCATVGSTFASYATAGVDASGTTVTVFARDVTAVSNPLVDTQFSLTIVC